MDLYVVLTRFGAILFPTTAFIGPLTSTEARWLIRDGDRGGVGEEIMSREVELGCESWTSFASSCSSTAVQRTLSL